MSIFEFCDMCHQRIPHHRPVYHLSLEPLRYGNPEEGEKVILGCDLYLCSKCAEGLEVKNL